MTSIFLFSNKSIMCVGVCECVCMCVRMWRERERGRERSREIEMYSVWVIKESEKIAKWMKYTNWDTKRIIRKIKESNNVRLQVIVINRDEHENSVTRVTQQSHDHFCRNDNLALCHFHFSTSTKSHTWILTHAQRET